MTRQTFGELSYPINCRQTANCNHSSNSEGSFKRHLLQAHFPELEVVRVQPEALPETQNEPIKENDNEIDIGVAMELEEEMNFERDIDNEFKDFRASMDKDIFNMVMKMRSHTSVPYTYSLQFMLFCKSLIVKLLDFTEKLLLDNVDSGTVAIFLNSLKSLFDPYKSEYYIIKQYENHPQYVSPKPIPFPSPSLSLNTDHNSFQYVPICSTIKSLVSQTSFCNQMLDKRTGERHGIYTEFRDGFKFKNHPLATLSLNPNTLVLFLQLYADGLGITNPLSVAAKDHQATMFYFSILNVPPKFNASLSTIHLAACCRSRY